VVASVEEARNGRYSFAVIYGIAYSLGVVFFAIRRWSYSLRSWVLMLVLFAIGFSELLLEDSNLTGEDREGTFYDSGIRSKRL